MQDEVFGIKELKANSTSLWMAETGKYGSLLFVVQSE